MRRAYLAFFAALALTFGMTFSAGAQADAGNDGVDTDCNNNFFTSQTQAQDYFDGDGGSAERNVDDLDRNNDGVACEDGIDDVGGDGSQFPGGDTGTDDGTTDDGTTDDGTTDDGTTDDGTTDDGTTDDGTTDDGTSDDGTADDGASDDGVTEELPDTGTGTSSSGSDSMLLVTVLGGAAALLSLAALRTRQER